MNIIGVIPARMAAKRLPNKPMELIHGIPMIGHVYQRSKLCQDFSEVYVATCDSEIMDYINKLNTYLHQTKNNGRKPCRCYRQGS